MKYAWIKRHQGHWPIALQCETLNVSVSGYVEYRHREKTKPPAYSEKWLSDAALLFQIKAAYAASKGEYGWPRIWETLRNNGIPAGKERIRLLMQQHGIKARSKRKFVVTTDSRHSLPVAPNLLNRDFQPARPNAVWAGDITYIPTDEGWLYLAAVIDLYSRQVIGWSMQPHMHASLVTDALRMAWFRRHPKPELIFHSDRGSQYCSHTFQQTLTEYGHAKLHESQRQLLGQCPR